MYEMFAHDSGDKKVYKGDFCFWKKNWTQIGKWLCTGFLPFLNSINIYWSAVILGRQVSYDVIPIDKWSSVYDDQIPSSTKCKRKKGLLSKINENLLRFSFPRWPTDCLKTGHDFASSVTPWLYMYRRVRVCHDTNKYGQRLFLISLIII